MHNLKSLASGHGGTAAIAGAAEVARPQLTIGACHQTERQLAQGCNSEDEAHCRRSPKGCAAVGRGGFGPPEDVSDLEPLHPPQTCRS